MKCNKKDEFIRKARECHGDNIDFSKVNYVNSQTKVCLICHKKDKDGNEHGEYWQVPASCIRGCTCPKCANERRSFKNKLTLEEFIRRERKIFGYRYDLSKVDKVVIEHKYRLTRFQFNLIKMFFKSYGVEIELTDKKDYTEQEELVNDMIMLLASFSGKVYSARARENKKKNKNI